MTKIKFGTDGWRAIIADEYTVENVIRVTKATVAWLKNHFESPSVMVGYDCRFQGKLFAETVANVMGQNGVKVFLSHSFVSTPMVSLATEKRQCSAGIVITASHNPPEYSGFKIKGHYGGPATPDMIDEVEGLIPDQAGRYENQLDALFEKGMVQYFDMEAVYINHIRQNFDMHLIRESGLKIGYDAMFGAGQAVFHKLVPEARLLHADFNPSFLGTAPEPIERNLKEFQQVIREEGLQVGLATDGDADRIGLFDENGDFVDSHHILLLLVYYLHKIKGQTGKVVFTFSVTTKLKKMCELYGLDYEITKVGFKYICEIMLNDSVLVGGEESGGLAVAGHVPERDGIYIGLMIMELMASTGKSLTELVQEVYDIVGSFSYQRNDLHLTNEKKDAIVAKCRAGYYTTFGPWEVQSTEDLDGIKFHLPEEQWIMVRPSGTEPVLRIYAESATREKVEALLEIVVDTLQNA